MLSSVEKLKAIILHCRFLLVLVLKVSIQGLPAQKNKAKLVYTSVVFLHLTCIYNAHQMQVSRLLLTSMQ